MLQRRVGRDRCQLEACGSKQPGPYNIGTRPEGLNKTTKILSQDNRSPSWDLKSGPPKYEAGCRLSQGDCLGGTHNSSATRIQQYTISFRVCFWKNLEKLHIWTCNRISNIVLASNVFFAKKKKTLLLFHNVYLEIKLEYIISLYLLFYVDVLK
jgi:hypothetical protein